ncbi:MAG TPA: cysteine-rich CWC family protein, partial [Gaiellaceae bacterium]|nr:cysteine-rich CWC family protein [Gaiellaceae bacterium]
MIEERTRRPALRVKQCSRCGKEFGCAHGEPGCWCESVVLDRETLAEIRELADDCLCPECLTSFAKHDGEAGERRATRWAKAIPHAAVRARGVSPAWALGAVAFVFGSLLFALAVGPISIGAGGIVESAVSHLPLLHVHSPLSKVDEAIL